MTNEDETRDRYEPDETRSLSTAILEAIERQTGDDLTKADFQLYEDINPAALDRLFKRDASSNTHVEFDTDDVTVRLRGKGDIEIQVKPREDR